MAVRSGQFVQRDGAVEFVEGLLELLLSDEAVSSGESVACVEADADAFWHADDGHHVRELAERESEIAALPRRVLEDGDDVGDFLKRRAHALADDSDVLRLWNDFQMASRMEIQHREAEFAAAREFVDEGVE